MIRDLVAVAIGGALGTGMRFALDLAFMTSDDLFPVSTLIANIIGSFVLAFIVAAMWRPSPSWARAGLGAGMLGSFTTFSALAVAAVHLLGVDQWILAVIYIAATMVLGLAAAAFGLWLGTRRAPLNDDDSRAPVVSEPMQADLVNE
ncbi:fluoride efflux transporter FluC [Rhodoglobus sp.]